MENPLEKLRNGELKLYALEKYMEADEAVGVRRQYIEEETGTSLESVGSYSIPIERVVVRNIENMIGCVQIPIGTAGPLPVNGEYANGTFWIPLATTEGALVASINRGCSAIAKAGGADVRIFQDFMTRAPVFAAKSIPHAADSIRWIEEHFAEPITLDEIAESIHISKSECCRCFQRVLRITPFEYLLKYRIFYATKLMQQQDPAASSISNLAITVGFGNISYFNKVFKRILNMTPTEYKKQEGLS